MPLSVFAVYSLPEFENYLRLTSFRRSITVIQNHHTFSPGYTDFSSRPDHFFWLEAMRKFHINERKWKDIGQNITTFPDGKIAVCRPIDEIPAGIFGANNGAICIENMGNFDKGKDQMTTAQKNSIVQLNALLCFKFSLRPIYEQVVYHHWYDRQGRRFPPERVNSGEVTQKDLQKTCPGTAFFGGNTINDATNNFYPLINQSLEALRQPGNVPPNFTKKKVTVSMVNVRSGRGLEFPVIRKLVQNSIVQVYSEFGTWSSINPAANEWVSSKFLAGV